MSILGNAAGTENKDAPKDGPGAGADGKPETDPVKVEAAKVAAAAAAKAEAETAAKAPFADLKQLKVPDGVKVDEPQLKKFLERAKAAGFSASQAQAMFDLNVESSKEIEAATKASIEAANTKAIDALKNDKEIGGTKFDESKKHVQRALAKYGGDGLTAALEEVQLADGSMLGDSVVMGRFLVRLGKSLREDSVGDGTGGTKKPEPLTPEAALGKGGGKGLFPKSPQLT